MAYLIDTTALGRLANASDAQHAVAARAVVELYRRGADFLLSGVLPRGTVLGFGA